ncbi:MAG: GatB/YqeY domain-containing protein [Anaerolineae bacterium]|nr:GatB/YqeY domain-containing protein [Anaerolineae bacterium]
MSLKEQLKQDTIDASKAGDNKRRDVLRMLQAAVKQVEVDDRVTLDDAGVEQVLTKQAKQRRESLAEYTKAGREDLAEQEKYELEIIEGYLPQLMSREEIEVLVKQVIMETGAASAKDTGLVMGKLMPQVKGKADGRLVNEVVREQLAG